MDPIFRDIAEYSIWCPLKEYWAPLLRCPQCRKFPCGALKEENLQNLEESLFTQKIIISLLSGKAHMYIFKMEDGALKYAPENFNPENFDPKILENVLEVYYISKIFVKQMKLVVKSREEIAKIRTTKKGQKVQE